MASAASGGTSRWTPGAASSRSTSWGATSAPARRSAGWWPSAAAWCSPSPRCTSKSPGRGTAPTRPARRPWTCTRTLAQEAAPFGVRVLALAPGAIQTAINEAVWRDPRSRADLLSKIPMGRLGQPDEVARMATVLVSDAASYVTGTTLFVDGGMTLYASFMHGG